MNVDDIEKDLWLDDSAASHPASSDRLLEQYKLYVEMADRVSQRRGLANTFFLTLNTGIFALIGSAAGKLSLGSASFLLAPLLAVEAQCLAWFFILRSYRQLNSAKYRVIGALEARLPASPYWRAEWSALGKGKDLKLYWPLSHLEQWLPVIFFLLYAVQFGVVLAGGEVQ